MNERLVSPPDAPMLMVKTEGFDRALRAGTPYRIGRDPQSDIVVNDSRVSWNHAVLQADRDSWILEDVGSTNGTFLGDHRIERVEITQNCVLRLGHPENGPVMMCAVAGAQPGGHGTAIAGNSRVNRRPTAVMRAPTRVMRIGRAATTTWSWPTSASPGITLSCVTSGAAGTRSSTWTVTTARSSTGGR